MADVVGSSRTGDSKGGLNYLDARTKIIQFLTAVAKFAADSAIVSSLTAATGRSQLQNAVKEGLNDKKPEELKLVMDEMQARMEEAEEQKKKMKQNHGVSAQSVDGTEALKKKLPGDDGIKASDEMENRKRKIFIRSRL